MSLPAIHPGVIGLFAAVAQWVVMASAALLSRAPFPESGMRPADRRMLISSILLIAVWLAVFDVRKVFQRDPAIQASRASSTRVAGLCAVVAPGMQSSAVRRLLGAPDAEESDEDTRGPGAKRWSYKESRCTIHFVDNQVELIE